MAKKVTGFIKLQIPAGKATPAPPVGPALGQHGVNIMEFVKQFNEKTAKQVDLCNAKGWKTVALLACVAFKEEPKPGEYWGQVAIISYDPVHEDAFSTFVKTIGNELGKGIRPALDLGNSGISRVLESKGAWVPTGRVPLPKLKKGSAFIKTERTTTDKLVNQARKTRVGCTIISWAIIIIFVVAVIFAMKSCGMF